MMHCEKLLSVASLLSSLVSATVVIPQPSGPYGVSLIDLEFTDSTRTDPYTGGPQRKIPISIITPTGPSTQCQPIQQAYMPEILARYWEQAFFAQFGIPLNNTFTQVALSVCKSIFLNRAFPLVLFSPGLGISRQFYSILSSSIAAQGFTVVTVDAPGQANFLVYQDGTTEYAANITTDEQITEAVNIRVEDLRFILSTLESQIQCPWQQILKFDTTIASVFGHSLGGAAALSAVEVDDRFIGAANLDGSLFGDVLNQTTTKPFLLFNSDDPMYPHNQTTVPSWAVVWPKLLGPKWQLMIKGSSHASYEDIPLLASYFGLYDYPGVGAILGTIDPHKAFDIQLSVLTTFASFLSGQKKLSSVIDVARSFSEVDIVNATNMEG